MERVNITDQINKKTFLGTLLLKTMTAAVDRGSDVMEHFNLEKVPDEGVWADVKLTINGVECDLQKFAIDLDSQLDRMIKEETDKAINEIKVGLNGTVNNLIADLKAKMGLRECTCHECE